MNSDQKIVLAPNSSNLLNLLYLIIGIFILLTTIYLPLILPLKVGLIILSVVIIIGYLYLIISFKPQVLITSQKIIFKLQKNESFEVPLSEINKIGFQKFAKGKGSIKLLGLKFENFSNYEKQFENSNKNTKNFIILGKNIKNVTSGLADVYLNIYFNLGQSPKKLETNLKNLKINLEDFEQINY